MRRENGRGVAAPVLHNFVGCLEIQTGRRFCQALAAISVDDYLKFQAPEAPGT
jgi:hypothetical protein